MTDWHIEVFYDEGCTLCRKEIAFLKRLDTHHRIKATNIDRDDFNPPEGFTWNNLMERIHGRLPDGTMIEGVEVFCHLYQAVGWSWVTRLARCPGLSQLFHAGYRIFATMRLRLRKTCSGNCALEYPRQPVAAPADALAGKAGSCSL